MSDGITYRRERIAGAWEEFLALGPAHLTETGTSRFTFGADRDLYVSLDDRGVVRFFVARTPDGRMIGYCSMVLTACAHDGAFEGKEDAVYIHPDYRGHTGPALERFVDEALAQDGVTRVFRERIIHGDLDRCTRRGPIGYRPQSVLWVRDLEVSSGE